MHDRAEKHKAKYYAAKNLFKYDFLINYITAKLVANDSKFVDALYMSKKYRGGMQNAQKK